MGIQFIPYPSSGACTRARSGTDVLPRAETRVNPSRFNGLGALRLWWSSTRLWTAALRLRLWIRLWWSSARLRLWIRLWTAVLRLWIRLWTAVLRLWIRLWTALLRLWLWIRLWTALLRLWLWIRLWTAVLRLCFKRKTGANYSRPCGVLH